jgi:hypothetical protein
MSKSGPAVAVGFAVTFTVTISVAVHPLLLEPVTVYDMVDAGLTVMLDPVNPPGFHI